ncbi:MAG TPA: lysylphosphatidylglycerol synthase transmembrane domain-containing protein [Candidatus Eisenbacteria bacterium]|nr:lysylphosphatidylglycerol synthase transmembrane domain-containing protein [Candidatus Eisenbacteria bacterium]
MISPHHSENRARGRLLITLRWLAAAAVIGALLHYLPLHLLAEAIRGVPVTTFVLILAGYLCAHTVGIVKWRMVVNAAGAALDFRTCAQCYTAGLFGTLFLPSIIGGDAVRLAVGLRRSANPAGVLAGNVADRLADMTAQAGLVLLGLVLLPRALPATFQAAAQKAFLYGGIGVGIVVLCVVLLFRPLFAGRSVRFRRRLARMRHAVRSVSGTPHVLGLAWLLATGIQTTFLLLTVWLAKACGLVLPLRDWFFAWPLAKLAALLPLTQGGIGVREAAMVGLLSPFGAAPHLVLAAGLVWEAVVLAGGLLAGLTAFVLKRGGVDIRLEKD